MFTGIIEDVGTITESRRVQDVTRVGVRCALDLSTVKIGDSIAVDGVCLTVTALAPGQLSFDAGPETRRVSTLADLNNGRRVHLERAMMMGGRLDGHLVSGHVDAMGHLAARRMHGETLALTIAAPREVLALCVPKGSICLDGVSLTLNAVSETGFEVWLIPHSLTQTHFADKKVGDAVNVENDIIGKYVQRLLMPMQEGVTWGFLEKHGFGPQGR